MISKRRRVSESDTILRAAPTERFRARSLLGSQLGRGALKLGRGGQVLSICISTGVQRDFIGGRTFF